MNGVDCIYERGEQHEILHEGVLRVIKRCVIKCEWRIILEYNSTDNSDLREVLAAYGTREEATEHMSDYYDNLSAAGGSSVLSVQYKETVLSEEIVDDVTING